MEANGLELAYEQFGADHDPAVLLIMGLGTQLTGWPDVFCHALADHGLRVIRFDNRDVGLSGRFCGLGRYDRAHKAFAKSLLGLEINRPYGLEDMAQDTIGLMDGLGIDKAHVVGASMGGMIAQLLAGRRPDRVATLTSIMSSSGARGLPRARLKLLLRLARAPQSDNPETVATHMATTMRLIGSPSIGYSQAEWQAELLRSVRRSYHPAGTGRQTLAVLSAGSRAKLLQRITQPALVIHGAADPLLPAAHGRDTARHLPNACYEEFDGMGHDLPPRLLARMVELIWQATAKAPI